MISTIKFFIWFFEGFGGIGGWILFFLVSATAVLYVFLDSGRRRLPAMAWRLGALLLALLVLPAIVYRFVAPETQRTLDQYLELLFYFGIIGGIVPFFVALGYYLHFRGMATCPNGHVYDPAYGECPDCLPPELPRREIYGGDGDITQGLGSRDTITTQFGDITLPFDTKEKANAFLLLPDGHHYKLNKGTTNIGKAVENDFVFDNKFVSKQHARIRQHEEKENLFRLADLDSTNGTWLNGRRVRRPRLLYSNDEIRFGTEATVVFIAKSDR